MNYRIIYEVNTDGDLIEVSAYVSLSNEVTINSVAVSVAEEAGEAVGAVVEELEGEEGEETEEEKDADDKATSLMASLSMLMTVAMVASS